MLLPTGRQYRIAYDRQAAIAVEFGAGLREYIVDGRRVLDGYAEGETATGSRGLPLLPWPNRIGGGRYRFAGDELQLPINDVGGGTAVHGLTRWVPWSLVAQTPSRVTLGTTIYPQPGYPFTLTLAVSYDLSAAGLMVETTARNDGPRPLPYGAGHHPYFATAGDALDRTPLRVPATRRLILAADGLPTGQVEAVERTPYDFLTARPIGEMRLNDCYVDLIRDADGRVRVCFGDTVVWADETCTHVMLFSGDTLPDPAERRRGLAVEPMTCPPDAFRSGHGVIVLAPGEAVTTRWGAARSAP